MNGWASLLLALAAIGVLLLPRRAAALPLLAGGCYLPVALHVEAGPFHFYGLRLLLAVALVRMFLRGERRADPRHRLDLAVWAWVAVALVASLGQPDPYGALVNRLGLAFNAAGTYLVVRAWCRTPDDLFALLRCLAWVLLPLGAAMLYEHAGGGNPFADLAGGAVAAVRGGEIRAQGPFSHPILAGSIGAGSLPLMAALWQRRRALALAGAGAALAMVVACGSSGPLLSAGIAVAALCAWPMRTHMRALRWSAVAAYVVLDAVMQAPAYYLLARVDLTGNSTSWHRAALIQAAIDHFPEWWLAGTAYTRHWLPYGVPWSATQIDITNFYIRMGVDGGIGLLAAFLLLLAAAFGRVGRGWRLAAAAPGSAGAFTQWTLGACLATHAAAFVSVSYFDQSVLFLFLVLGLIGAPADPAAVALPAPAPMADAQAGPGTAAAAATGG